MKSSKGKQNSSKMKAHNHGESIFGTRNPISNRIHGHDEVVLDKNCDEWVKEWIRWLVSIAPDRSPLLPKYEASPFEEDDSQTHKAKPGGEGVWFLAAPIYGSGLVGQNSKYIVIERGSNHILFAPVMFYHSGDGIGEYPSRNSKQLFNMAVDDLKSVTNLEAKLDGMNLFCCRTELDRPFDVPIPSPNILGIQNSEIRNSGRNPVVGMVCAGYTVFLRPLDPGLHLLSYQAYTRNYSLSAQFSLNVRGP
jgi:hypothetical protein